MIVRLLEDSSLYELTKGMVINIPDEIAHELISKGIARKENATNREAYDALVEGKNRDEQQTTDGYNSYSSYDGGL